MTLNELLNGPPGLLAREEILNMDTNGISNRARESTLGQRFARFRHMYRMYEDRLGTELLSKGLQSQIIEEWQEEISGFNESTSLDSIEKMLLSKYHNS